MAFIPIHAKADISESKKGKLTPAQAAILNAWCLPERKTGILFFPSDKGKAGRCEATASVYTATNYQAVVVFHKGYIVICGRLIECEEGTEVVVQTPASGVVNGRIILRYSLANSKEAEFTVTTKQGDLTQQDLNENPTTGIYEFELDTYTATPTNVFINTRSENDKYIYDANYAMEILENKINYALYDDYKAPLKDYNKNTGTIEQRLSWHRIDIKDLKDRLDLLGFKSGAISFVGGSYGSAGNTDTASNGVFRQGNYVFGNLNATFSLSQDILQNYFAEGKVLFTLPENFRPKTPKAISITAYKDMLIGSFIVNLYEDGNAYVAIGSATEIFNENCTFIMSFGFEAPPIT